MAGARMLVALGAGCEWSSGCLVLFGLVLGLPPSGAGDGVCVEKSMMVWDKREPPGSLGARAETKLSINEEITKQARVQV